MNDEELKHKRRELAEKVRGGTVHTAHPVQKKEQQAGGCLSFWFWLKAFFLTGCGSLSGMMVVLLLSLVMVLFAGCVMLAISAGLGVYLLDLLNQIANIQM